MLQGRVCYVKRKKVPCALIRGTPLSKRDPTFQGKTWIKYIMEKLPWPSWSYGLHTLSQTLKSSDGLQKWKRNDTSLKPVDQAKSFQMLRTKDKVHFPAGENGMSCNNCNCHFRAF